MSTYETKIVEKRKQILDTTDVLHPSLSLLFTWTGEGEKRRREEEKERKRSLLDVRVVLPSAILLNKMQTKSTSDSSCACLVSLSNKRKKSRNRMKHFFIPFGEKDLLFRTASLLTKKERKKTERNLCLPQVEG